MAKRVARAIVAKNEDTESRTQEEESVHTLIVLRDQLRRKLLGRVDG